MKLHVILSGKITKRSCMSRLRAVPPFPSCDRVPSVEAQAARRTVLPHGPVLRARYTIAGGTTRSLLYEGGGGLRCFFYTFSLHMAGT